MTESQFETGLETRKAVMGTAYVDAKLEATTPFSADFQRWITEAAWAGVWSRSGLPRRERSMLTVALLAALGHHEELALHLRATRRTGATPDDIKEVMLHVGVYAGIPAANAAMRVAEAVFAEDD